jgi:hypothetical protein
MIGAVKTAGGEVSPVGNVETMPASRRSISPLLLERAGVA